MRALLRWVAVVTLAAVGAACSESTAPSSQNLLAVPSGPSAAISDAENGGRAGFYFLPPLVPDPSPFPGTFDPTRQPTASLCALNSAGTGCQGGAIMTFPFGGGAATSITVNLAGQSYNATWSKANLSVGKYRLAVYDVVPGFGQQLLGFLDIQVVASSKALKSLDPGFVGLVRNSPLSIKFRIENGTVGVVTVAPSTATILVGGTQAFTATVYDLDGNAMASPPAITWASSAPSVATVSSTGLATGVSGGTTFIRATSGGVTGEAELTVIAEVAPSVTTTVPVDGATGVATGSNVSITFNEPVNVAGDWFEIACGTSGTRKPSVVGSVAVSGGPTTFTLDPASDFSPGESCTVTVFATQVTDQDANDPPDNMAANYVFSFSTADNAPYVTSTTPAHQATGVAKNTTITVNFSESVNVSASSFTLSCGTSQSFQLGGTSPGTSFTLDPDADLPGDTECTLTVVAAQVTDADAVDPPDNMSADFVVTFTTQPNAAAPDALDDDFSVAVSQTLNGDVTADNGHGADDLGSPAATVTSFGGGSLGGTVTSNAAGASVSLAGGTLTVNANGTLSLASPTAAGVYTFTYRLTNSTGSDDATVTITVTGPPVAVDDAPAANSVPGDALHGAVNTTFTLAAPGLLANDNLGVPAGTITKFGKIQMVGTVDDNSAGASVTFLTTGSLTVNADGSVSLTPPNGFTGYVIFEYRVANSAGSDVGQATIAIGHRPVPDNDTYPTSLVGNVKINTAKAGGTGFTVLTGDVGDAVTVAVTGPATNGDVVLNANGTFTFNPAAGFSNGNASFSYTLTNGFGTSAAATVTIPVSNNLIWFVDNSGAAGDGRLGTPLNALAALNGAGGSGDSDDPGDHIFLYTGNASYTGGLILENNQRLIGQGATASLASVAGVTLPSDVENFPTTGGTAPTLVNAGGNGVTLASGNTLRGFNLGNATGSAISGSSFGTLTVLDLGINTSGQALGLTTGTLSATFSGITSAGGSNNINLSGVTASGTVALGSGALSGATGEAFLIAGASSGTFTYGGSITGGNGAAVSISGGTASVSLSGNVSQANAFPLVNVSGHATGTLAMTGQVSATNGSGLQFNNADGTYNLGSVAASSALNGGDAGIDILNGSSGTFTFGSNLSITNPSGHAFFVGASAATVTMNGAISQNGGKRGVFLENNTGGSTTFTGALTLNTTTATAFEATATSLAGSVTVQTATANVLSTTTATALRVNNVNIATGLTFRSISSNGAPSGIVLNSTGNAAGLTVAGNGGVCTVATPTCTGGWIQASTGAGIDLANTAGTSLTLVRVSGGGDDGIRGSSVTGFTLASSLVSGNGNALNENGLDFTGLFGTASITGSVITGSFNNNAVIRNTSGTLTSLTVSNTTISNNVSTSDGDGLLVDASQTANMSVNVSNSIFAAHHSDHFQAAAANSAVLVAVFTNNTLSGGHASALGQGITINAATGAPGFSGSVTYDINGNTINGAISTAIVANLGTSASGAVFKGQIRNNAIGTSGVALSCSAQGNGINIDAHGNGTHTVSVTGNTLKRCFDYGILATVNDGNGAANLTVTNNTVNEQLDTNGITGTPREAFQLNAGATSTNVFGQVDSHAVCLNLSGASGSLIGGAGKNGDIRLRQRFQTSVRLPGYAGTAFDNAAVITFVQGNNPGSTATVTSNNDAAVTTDGYFGGAACTLP